MGSRQLIQTNDGSFSILDTQLNASFHSIHGALTESKHVYIETGLAYQACRIQEINLFEFGFGTGLNALLSLKFAQEHKIQVSYTALDNQILDNEFIHQLDYIKLPEFCTFGNSFGAIHEAKWNFRTQISEFFSLHKIHENGLEFEADETFDLIYYDAFGPEVQPELWDILALQKVYEMMKPGAVFCTYCAKGSVKRQLQQLGLKVESLAGPPGKREITRAIK